MHRSNLKNIHNKKRIDATWANYKKTTEFLCLTYWRTKTDLSDNEKFWKTIQPYFSNKGSNSNKMLFKEKVDLVSDEKQLASVINQFFINITKSLNLKEDREALSLLSKTSLKLFFN